MRAPGPPGLLQRPSRRLAAIETDILYDTCAVINAMPFSAGGHRHRTGLMSELRRDGLDL